MMKTSIVTPITVGMNVISLLTRNFLSSAIKLTPSSKLDEEKGYIKSWV
jgi:hypothetical protein